MTSRSSAALWGVYVAHGGLYLQHGGVGQGGGRYQLTGRSLENGGCIGEPHLQVERCLVFLCILHCCMAMGRLQVAFIEARLEDLPKENTEAVQRLLYRARTGVKLGASTSPDGEEARALFLAWEEMGPLLAYTPEDREWQAIVAMRDLLRGCTLTPPPLGPCRRQQWQARTGSAAARPPASPTTCCTWRRTWRWRWPMQRG